MIPWTTFSFSLQLTANSHSGPALFCYEMPTSKRFLTNRRSKCHRLTCWLNTKNKNLKALQCCRSWWYILTFRMCYYLSLVIYYLHLKKTKRLTSSKGIFHALSSYTPHQLNIFCNTLSFATFLQNLFCLTQCITSSDVSPELSLCSNCCHLHAHALSFSATLAPPSRAAAAIKAALQARDGVITPPKEEIDHGGPSNNHI